MCCYYKHREERTLNQVRDSLPEEGTEMYKVLQQLDEDQEFVCWCVLLFC